MLVSVRIYLSIRNDYIYVNILMSAPFTIDEHCMYICHHGHMGMANNDHGYSRLLTIACLLTLAAKCKGEDPKEVIACRSALPWSNNTRTTDM